MHEMNTEDQVEPQTAVAPVRLGIRARLLRRLGVVSNDRGLATTETVILTAFLVALAAAGGAILYKAMQHKADLIDQTTVSIPSN